MSAWEVIAVFIFVSALCLVTYFMAVDIKYWWREK